MSGVLESLRNPLERLSLLPTTMCLRSDLTTGDAEWASDVQYFKNDVVTNDGVAWVFVSGPAGQTTSLGGLSPSATNDTTIWCPLGTYPLPPSPPPTLVTGTAIIPLLSTSFVVPNTSITTSSVVMITPMINDATATRFWVTLNSGVSFTINTNAAPTTNPVNLVWYIVKY